MYARNIRKVISYFSLEKKKTMRNQLINSHYQFSKSRYFFLWYAKHFTVSLKYFLLFFFFFCYSGVWTQGLMIARQAYTTWAVLLVLNRPFHTQNWINLDSQGGIHGGANKYKIIELALLKKFFITPILWHSSLYPVYKYRMQVQAELSASLINVRTF
jgi:hypothetical protein